MTKLPVQIASLMLALMLLPSADAFWFNRKDKGKKEAEEAAKAVQTFQPPSADALEMYCEPIRKEALAISNLPRMQRMIMRPRKSWLIHQHEKCKKDYMTQEYEYLKHADIQRAPSLPKLKAPEGEQQGPKIEEKSPDAPAKP